MAHRPGYNQAEIQPGATKGPRKDHKLGRDRTEGTLATQACKTVRAGGPRFHAPGTNREGQPTEAERRCTLHDAGNVGRKAGTGPESRPNREAGAPRHREEVVAQETGWTGVLTRTITAKPRRAHCNVGAKARLRAFRVRARRSVMQHPSSRAQGQPGSSSKGERQQTNTMYPELGGRGAMKRPSTRAQG